MAVPARSNVARSGFTRSGLGGPSSSAPDLSASGASTLRRLIGIARDRILESLALITPGAPLVSPQLVVGTTPYTYRLAATNTTGHSPASGEGVTAIGVASLSPDGYNRLTWTPVKRATGYQIWRTAGGPTQGLIATIGDYQMYDDGGTVADPLSLPPTSNTSGTLGQFWSDEELLGIMILGAKDLWRAFIDLHQEHFFTVNDTDVSLLKAATSLSGIPANVHRVLLIAPRDTSPTGTGRAVRFTPADYNSPEFLGALTRGTIDPGQAGTVYYAMTGAGAPVGAPTVYTAPQLSDDLPIRLVYIPTLSGALTFDDVNPVPGESDAALIAYCVAFALAKQHEDNSPDPNWLAVYSTEKNSCLVASAPRQEQEASYVTGVFDAITGPGLSGWDDD
jgi:hypothetical protein